MPHQQQQKDVEYRPYIYIYMPVFLGCYNSNWGDIGYILFSCNSFNNDKYLYIVAALELEG